MGALGRGRQAKGADVKALRQRLAALKYYPGAIDGVFGGGTLEAVWAFQEVNHLPADGVVGATAKRALVNPRAFKPNDPFFHKMVQTPGTEVFVYK